MSAKLKNAIKAINKSALICGSLGSLALSGITFAQDDSGLVEEEVIVTGIRGALKNAVDIKRNNTAGVDAVSAEDVGKFPDSDVGEALGRIPGVTVGRAFGQGASVSIRGSSPQMTLTQLNGQNVASTGWYDQQAVDRSFNYSLLPSQLIGGIDVYKTSQADLNEGGIGGTVIVKTRKPLDLDANTVFFGLKARTGTISDDVSPEVSAMYSWKTDSETFGVLVAGAWEDSDYVRRGTEADYRWWGDVSPTTFVQNRERTALDATLQFAPTEALSMTLHALTLNLTGDNTNTSLYLFTQPPADADGDGNPDLWSCTGETNAAGLCLESEVPEAVRGDLQVGWANNTGPGTETFTQTWGRIAEMTSETYDFNIEYEGDGFSVGGSLGSTKAEGGTDLTLNFQHFPSVGAPGAGLDDGDPMSLWAGSIDATGHQIEITTTVDPSLTLSDYAAMTAPQAWAVGKSPNSDEESYIQVDLEFDLDLGAITSFKTGLRRTDHDVERFNFRGDITPTAIPTSSVYSGTYEVGTNGFTTPEPVLSAMVNSVRGDLNKWDERRSGYSLLNEQNDALYGMFEFEAEGVKGNFGLRYIASDLTRSQYALDGTALSVDDIGDNSGYSHSLSKTDADYDDVLPSFNVAFDLTDNFVLRASASETISRPNYDDMVEASSGYGDDRVGNETIKVGSEGLLPMKSSQADLGLEFYYGEGNLASVTYFVKSINNFVVHDIKTNQSIGVVEPEAGDVWTVDTLKNAGGGEIDGVELQWNHGFENGFGFVVNYTIANANAPAEAFADRIGIFTESSSDSANLVGYWENDTFSARAAYNWRSEYIIREGAFWYGDRYHDDYGTLDLSFGWNVAEFVSLSFEATNLFAEDDVQYGAADASAADNGIKAPLLEGFPAWSFEGETTYMLGVNFQF